MSYQGYNTKNGGSKCTINSRNVYMYIMDSKNLDPLVVPFLCSHSAALGHPVYKIYRSHVVCV